MSRQPVRPTDPPPPDPLPQEDENCFVCENLSLTPEQRALPVMRLRGVVPPPAHADRPAAPPADAPRADA